jgi:hypothetical protein
MERPEYKTDPHCFWDNLIRNVQLASALIASSMLHKISPSASCVQAENSISRDVDIFRKPISVLKLSFFSRLHLLGKYGIFFVLEFFELVTLWSAEALLALNLSLLLCIFFLRWVLVLCSCGYACVYVYFTTCQTCGCVK